MRVIWTGPALDQIERVYEYLCKFHPRAAMRVADTIRAEGDSLVNFPHRRRPVPGTNMRELALTSSATGSRATTW